MDFQVHIPEVHIPQFHLRCTGLNANQVSHHKNVWFYFYVFIDVNHITSFSVKIC